MNPRAESVQLSSRLVFMAKQLHGEAQRQPAGEVRNELERGARQLLWAHRAAYDLDRRAEVRALIDGAIDYLVGVMTARLEREVTEGTTP